MSLKQQLRTLLERHTNLHIPQLFGSSLSALSCGAVIDLRGDARGKVGDLSGPTFGLTLPSVHPTGALDIALSLKRTLDFKAKLGGTVTTPAVSGQVSATAEVKEGRDVVVVVEPAAGETLSDVLALASALGKHPAWRHDDYAFVLTVFMAASGEVAIAKSGGGSVTLTGSAEDVSKAITGHASGGVTWTFQNLYSEKFSAPGVFGVHLVKVSRSGRPKFI
jgi:hypothetical protein